MSYRDTLPQLHPVDYSSTSITKRQHSTASNSSSAYSHPSDASHISRTSTVSSTASSGYQSTLAHKRGHSEGRGMSPAYERDGSRSPTKSARPEELFQSARASLRPLPKVPSDNAPPPPKHKKTASQASFISQTSAATSVASHSKHSSLDLRPFSHEPSISSSPPRPLPIRPNSLLMSRADSTRPLSRPTSSSANDIHQHHNPSPLVAPDLKELQKSSTSHLRTLSKFADTASPDQFAISSPQEEVVGLHGRRRLQRTDRSGSGRGTVALNNGSGYGWEGRNWMDKQRQFLQAYEYLCHIGEAKEWIEDVIHKDIPPIVQLEEALRDGVTLAELVEVLQPDRKFRIFRNPKLQYRHSDNIAIFFRFLNEIELPELFRFELIDLYEKKNIPKVIYCIHALSWLLFRLGIVDFRIGNLVGKLQFEDHELEDMQKGLDKAGVSMPTFGNMGADFGVEPEPEPEPEPVESEEDRIDRELHESEDTIVDLQAQIRGALLRMELERKMNGLWDSEDWLVDLQSRIRGDFARQIIEYRLNMRRFAINLQSASRGFIVRQRQQQRDDFWKSREVDILRLQNLIRARKARHAVAVTREQLQKESYSVENLQSAVRGLLVRKRMSQQAKETKSADGPVLKLQAAIKGMLLRDAIARDNEELLTHEPAITEIQANVRAMLERQRVAKQLDALEASEETITSLQSAARAGLLRQQMTALRKELKSHSAEITSLQAIIRAGKVRDQTATLLAELEDEEPEIIELQGAIRGMLARDRIAADYEALQSNSAQVTRLQGHVRGLLHRKVHKKLLADLESNVTEIIDLQGMARAMLLRNVVGDLLQALDAEEDSVVMLQAHARAKLVRARFAEKQKFYRQNMEKVIKIQSFVRGRLQGEAYKSLTTGKNPPVNTVKNFVHLLNDSDFDFNEEVEFERMRKTVVQQVRQNEMAEQYIEQLDIKIALLVKNKITLDDVMQHQRNHGAYGAMMNPSMMGNNFDLKALNKNSRQKLDSYQQLFFTLQTQPQYLARLFRRIREEGMPETETKRIEKLMMGLFGYAQKRREEYYLLKLISRSIREEAERSQTIEEYLRGNFFWSKLMGSYTRSPKDRKFMRDLLGPLIRENIIDDLELDLESDPLQIYRSAINNEELSTGRPSRRPLDVSREVAIKDKETRDLFIIHLQDLREIADQFLQAFDETLPRMPYGIRYISEQLFSCLAERFPRMKQAHILQIVGQWVFRFYIQPALTDPQGFGVIEKQLTPLQKRNLSEVAKVLTQVTTGKLFSGENIFLQPLNAYIGTAIERMGMIFAGMIDVVDAEHTFDIDEFNDLYSKIKPTLYIKMTDIFAIHNLITKELQEICPNRDDMLREIVRDLGSARSNEAEWSGVKSAEITLTLNPKLHDIEDPEAEVKALFMETKRCVLYIIRVQSGPNLMDILVRPVTREDEYKWQQLLQEEFGPNTRTRGAYSDANMADITAMSYAELKRTALENIMRLETQFGRISRSNHYQDILNAIALDIRTKSRRRVQRQREIDGVRMTLSNLHEKAAWLEQQRKSYDNYIEQAMMTLQNKKGKKRFLLPFTRQYNHERSLARMGKHPKFGSFKYSARNLYDKGVLVSFSPYTEKQYEKISITISCDEVGVFELEGSMGNVQLQGCQATIPLEDCLTAQFNGAMSLVVWDGGAEGSGVRPGTRGGSSHGSAQQALKLNVNLFLHLIYKKFYRSE